MHIANLTREGGGGEAIKIPKQRQMNILFFWLQKMQNSWKALEMLRGAEDGRAGEWVEKEKRMGGGETATPCGAVGNYDC